MVIEKHSKYIMFQDCNGDGIINCNDYAKIHRLGGYGCSAPLDAIYQQKYDNCQRQVQQFVPVGAG